jgi:hypothetical protein
MLPDFGPVEEALRAWAAAAGVSVDQVVLNRRGRPVVVLPLNKAPAGQGGRFDEPREERGKGLHPCVEHILAVLREAGRPLTGMRILEEMAKKGIEWSKTTVETHVADMMRDGIIENVQEGKLRGYRIAE